MERDGTPRFSLRGLSAELPPTTVGEDDLQSAFRASATSIVELLRAGQRARQRAFQAGVSAALDDVRLFLQHGLDHQQPSLGLENLLNYIEARQAALRSESEESEDEPPAAGPSRPRSAPPPSTSAPTTSSHVRTAATPPPPSPGPTPVHTRNRPVVAQHAAAPPPSSSPTIAPANTVFTFDCPAPTARPTPTRRSGRSARAVVMEAAASVVGVKRPLPTVEEAVDVRMEEEAPTSHRAAKRVARTRPG